MTLLQDESTDEDGAKERYQSSCGAKRSGRSASTSRDRRGSRRRASGTARRADRAARGALRRGRSRLGHAGRAVPVVAVRLAAARRLRVVVVVNRRLSSTRRGRVAVPLTISQLADMTRKSTGRVLQWSPCGSQAPEPVGEGGSDWDSEAAWGEAATMAAWPRRTSESHDWGCILTGLVQRRTKGLC